MDQPNAPPSFSDAMAAISAKLLEVEAALTARARQFDTDFWYASKPDTTTRIVVVVSPEGLFVGHPDTAHMPRLDMTSTQLRLALADEAPLLCVRAAEFYARLASLRASDYDRKMEVALVALSGEGDDRDANMPRR